MEPSMSHEISLPHVRGLRVTVTVEHGDEGVGAGVGEGEGLVPPEQMDSVGT